MAPKITIAHIIPCARLKPNLDFFSYEVPKNLVAQIQKGSVVLIPFRKKFIPGIVSSITLSAEKPTQYELKSIEALHQSYEPLSQYFVDFIIHTAQRSIISPATLLHGLFPVIPKKKHSVTLDDYSSQKESLESPPPTHTAHTYKKNETLWATLLKINKKETGQILILFPYQSQVDSFEAFLKQKNISSLSHTTTRSKNEALVVWNAIASGRVKLTLGTRSAVFLPFNKLSQIVIVDEYSEEYKQSEQTPRYNAYTLAQELAMMHGASCTHLSTSLRLETLHAIAQKKITYTELDVQLAPPFIHIIDANKEAVAHNYSLTALPLQDAIENALNQKSKTLLILNKKGHHSGYICAECKAVYDESYKQNICEECRSARLQPLKKGLETLKEQLHTQWPQARIATINAELEKNAHEYQGVVQNADICIGTEFAIRQDLSLFSVIGIIKAELLQPRYLYSSQEQLFHTLKTLKQRLEPSQALYIQTKDPDSFLMNALISASVKDWYISEYEQRKKYHFPPHSLLINVIAKGSTRDETEKNIEKAYIELSKKLIQCEVGEPEDVRKKGTHYESSFFIKTSPDSTEIFEILRNHEYLYDIDPI